MISPHRTSAAAAFSRDVAVAVVAAAAAAADDDVADGGVAAVAFVVAVVAAADISAGAASAFVGDFGLLHRWRNHWSAELARNHRLCPRQWCTFLNSHFDRHSRNP